LPQLYNNHLTNEPLRIGGYLGTENLQTSSIWTPIQIVEIIKDIARNTLARLILDAALPEIAQKIHEKTASKNPTLL
jgi:hypothetical protein